MENEQQQRHSRGRSGSRASSTSSSLEVRCACQYYLSDSLLPERSALAAAYNRTPTATKLIYNGAGNKRINMVQTPPAGKKPPARCGDNDYEPIGQPIMRLAVSQHSVVVRSIAPVVKITDTDVAPVADSDDSIDDRYRFRHGALILDGDVILPLDGRIEDDAMDGRNLGDRATIDSADEIEETTQQLQDRLEERFFGNERSNGIDVAVNPQVQQPQRVEIVTSDDDATTNASTRPGLQQRIKCQAGKIRSRFKNIQKPTFRIPKSRAKTTTLRSSSPAIAKTPPPPSSPRSDKKASRMERFRMALPERPRFNLPDKSRFHLPERPKFHLPERAKFHIKKPNIQLGLTKKSDKLQRTPSQRSTAASQKSNAREPSELDNQSQQQQEEDVTDDTSSTKPKRNIFDFSTLPRPRKLFERKAKAEKANVVEIVAVEPKEIESSTFPRAKKTGGGLSLSARWAQRFGETVKHFHHNDDEQQEQRQRQNRQKESAIDRTRPWRHPSLEEPRLSLKPQVSEENADDEADEDEDGKLPWENQQRRIYDDRRQGVEEEEDIVYADSEEIKATHVQILKGEKELVRDPRLEDEQLMKRIEPGEPKKRVRLVEEDDGSMVDPETEDANQTYHPKALYDGSFPPVDPPEFRDERGRSVDLSEEDDEGSSMRSDREIQQSSGSSCERRRRGVIEEIDSDEFFLREKGISEENVMRFQLMNDIRDALRPRDDEAQQVPPERPDRRKRLAHKRREASSIESFEAPAIQTRGFERAGSVSSSRHRVVYHTGSSSRERDDELLDNDGVGVVKPARRKSRSSLGSSTHISSRLPIDEQNIVLAPIHQQQQQVAAPPVVPSRRKRLRRDHQQSSSLSIKTADSAMYNGFGHSHERIPPTPPPTPPAYSYRRHEDRDVNNDDDDYIEPPPPPPPPPKKVHQATPIPPKRTRSRTTSLAAPEDDRTSHGADSLPGDFGFVDDEDIAPTVPRHELSSSSREPSLPGYAVIDKREKPPRPPPPRRKKQGKFATAPRPAKKGIISGPKRPFKNCSTLRSAKSDTIRSSGSMPFIDADLSLDNYDHEDDYFNRDLQRSGEILDKIQGRPLPAPPRPPRHRRSIHMSTVAHPPRDITPDFSETVASTQTDPLPDDLVIEESEEIMTTAKLVVTPSRLGSSQVLICEERQPSPASGSYRSAATPPIPPLPSGQPTTRDDVNEERYRDRDTDHKAPSSADERQPPVGRFDPAQLEILRSALFSTDEPLRIPSLEVGDLRVEKLTVSQLEAYKVAASEIDAIVVSATEMSSKGETEGGIHPSLLQELIAIRNQLEAVTAAQQSLSRPQSAMEDAYTATSNERVDITIEEQQKEQHRSRQEADKKSPPQPRRSPLARESSPLLMVVQPSVSEKVPTADMGRTTFPLSGSSSTTDLSPLSTAESCLTVSDITTIVTTEIIESLVETTVAEQQQQQQPKAESPSTTPATPATAETTATTTESSSEKKPRSRSSSPSHRPGVVRQTASPVKSLPPVISVTPDVIATPDTTITNNNNMPLRHVTSSSGVQPQRAVISYSTEDYTAVTASSLPSSRETSQSPPPQLPLSSSSSPLPVIRNKSPSRSPSSSPLPQPVNITTTTVTPQFIAFPTSHIPPEFFTLANPPLTTTADNHHHHHHNPHQNLHNHDQQQQQAEPSIADTAGQLLRALHQAGNRSLRHFLDSVVSRFVTSNDSGSDNTIDDGTESGQKIRRVELTLCALLVLVACLIVVCICTPRTVTHHHHWDYFNPPQ